MAHLNSRRHVLYVHTFIRFIKPRLYKLTSHTENKWSSVIFEVFIFIFVVWFLLHQIPVPFNVQCFRGMVYTNYIGYHDQNNPAYIWTGGKPIFLLLSRLESFDCIWSLRGVVADPLVPLSGGSPSRYNFIYVNDFSLANVDQGYLAA